MNGAWNLLKGFFNWFGEKIQWAKNLWSGIKGFFDGNDGDGDGNGDGTRSQILISAIMALWLEHWNGCWSTCIGRKCCLKQDRDDGTFGIPDHQQ